MKPIYLLVLLGVCASSAFALESGKKYNFRFKDGQHLRNATLLEETKKSYRVKIDYLDEEKIVEKKDLKELPVIAHTLSAQPASGSQLKGLERIILDFAEPVLGADKIENYLLSGEGKGSLTFAGVKQLTKLRYELLLQGRAANGELAIKLLNITDNVGAALSDDGLVYKLDVILPTWVSTPSENSTLNEFKQLTIQYSETVSLGDRLKNYALSGPGAKHLKLISVKSMGDNTYALRLGGKPTQGKVIISIKNVYDSVGNPLAKNELGFEIDMVKPLLASLPKAGSLLNALNKVILRFSKPVTGADEIQNYSISGQGAGNLEPIKVTRLESGEYQLELDGKASTGVVKIEVKNVADLANNPLEKSTLFLLTDVDPPKFTAMPPESLKQRRLAKTEISFSKPVRGADQIANYSIEGEGGADLKIQTIERKTADRYTIKFVGEIADGTVRLRFKNILDAAGNAPEVDFIEYQADISGPTCASLPLSGSHLNKLETLDLQFSEPISGAENRQNFSFTGQGAKKLRVVKVEALAENQYRLHLAGDINSGNIDLRFKNKSMLDRAGNSLLTSHIAFQGDISPPHVATIVPKTRTLLNGVRAIDVEFSEPVLGAEDIQRYGFEGPGAGTLKIDSVKKISDAKFHIEASGVPANGEVTLLLKNGHDVAGNLLAEKIATYEADVTAPIMSTQMALDKPVAKISHLDLQFSEPVVGATALSNYVLSGKGAQKLQVEKVTESGGKYRLFLSGTAETGELKLTASNIFDLAGNRVSDNSIVLAADTGAPLVSFTPEAASVTKGLESFEVKFSEPVVGALAAQNYRLSGPGVGSLKVNQVDEIGNNSYRVLLNGRPVDGSIEIQIQNVTDVAGNTLRQNQIVYAMDMQAPRFEVSPKTGTLTKDLEAIRVTYSETVKGADLVTNYTLSGDGLGTLRVERVVLIEGNTYGLLLVGEPTSGAVELTIANISDAAGNELLQSRTVYTIDATPPVLVAFPEANTTLISFEKIVLQFSKPVNGAADIKNYSLTGPGAKTLKIESVALKGDEYILTFTGEPADGHISVQLKAISDKAGNLVKTRSINYKLDVATASQPCGDTAR